LEAVADVAASCVPAALEANAFPAVSAGHGYPVHLEEHAACVEVLPGVYP